MGPKNSIRFFEQPGYRQHDWNWYLRHFKRAREGQVIGDARVEYLYNPETAGLIHRHLPGCKLIFQLREPVERAVSAYLHSVRRGILPDLPLEKGLECARQAAQVSEKGRPENQLTRIITMGCYAQQLEEYLCHFPLRQILILLHDDITHNPLGCIQASQRFVGVEIMRPRELFRTPLKSAGIPILNALERGSRRIHGSVKVWDWCNRGAIRIGLGRGRLPLESSVHSALKELYAPHNQRLLKLLELYRNSGETISDHFGTKLPDWILSG